MNSNPGDLATATYTLFLGSSDMSKLQEYIHSEKNYQKSSMLLINPPSPNQSVDELQSDMLTEMNRYKSINNGKYDLEDIILDSNGNAHLKFSYEKHVTGRLSLLSKKKRTITVQIEKVSEENKLRMDIRQADSSDSKEFMKFLQNIQKPRTETDPALFNIERITLDALEKQKKIEFFDLLSKYKFKEWKLANITGITVTKSNSPDDEDTTIEMDESGTLAGITSAVLRGSSLRTNEFVQNCLSQGFIITSMRFKYEHKSTGVSIIIDVNFKNTDIRIDIEKTYTLEDDGKEHVNPISFSEQDEIIKTFQPVAYKIYKDLLNSQQNQTVS